MGHSLIKTKLTDLGRPFFGSQFQFHFTENGGPIEIYHFSNGDIRRDGRKVTQDARELRRAILICRILCLPTLPIVPPIFVRLEITPDSRTAHEKRECSLSAFRKRRVFPLRFRSYSTGANAISFELHRGHSSHPIRRRASSVMQMKGKKGEDAK